MGWLYQQTSVFFSRDDGSYPEICVCNLNPDQVIRAYKLIRKFCGFVVGRPRFFNREQACEMALDEIGCAAELVTDSRAQPFHFMVRNLKFGKDWQIHELGVFVMPNAIALDYVKGPAWGELEIESLLVLIMLIIRNSPESFVRLEEEIPDNLKAVFRDSMLQLKDEIGNLPDPVL
ncbi:MAG: hypothetical protein ACOYXC_16900 [Candidatus Rifleibacteriota bacterium]